MNRYIWQKEFTEFRNEAERGVSIDEQLRPCAGMHLSDPNSARAGFSREFLLGARAIPLQAFSCE
jgi:hypothetical protein